jgi:hypothetical protein
MACLWRPVVVVFINKIKKFSENDEILKKVTV